MLTPSLFPCVNLWLLTPVLPLLPSLPTIIGIKFTFPHKPHNYIMQTLHLSNSSPSPNSLVVCSSSPLAVSLYSPPAVLPCSLYMVTSPLDVVNLYPLDAWLYPLPYLALLDIPLPLLHLYLLDTLMVLLLHLYPLDVVLSSPLLLPTTIGISFPLANHKSHHPHF